MKKVLFLSLSLIVMVTLAACGKDYGEYKPGLHLGYTDGHQNTYAYVYVDADGYIDDIFIDSVYLKTDDDGPLNWEARGSENTGYVTTKMSLDHGCGYNMWPGQPVEDCEVEGEIMWVDQVRMLAEDIIENQGVPSYDINEDGDFEGDDVIAGVTITVTSYIEAVENALEIAKLGEDESPADFDVPSFSGTGDYEPGINFGYTDGHQNTIAVVAVNADGHIEHIGIDTIYMKASDEALVDWVHFGNERSGIATTKMSLDHGCGYNMWPGEPVEDCEVEGEIMWVAQVQMLADDIVENQGVPSYDINEDGDFEGDDVIAGVTVTVTSYIEAVQNALD